MPQITKGGKYIFGWTEFKNGKIAIPDKVVHEYGLDSKYILLMESSKKSGGFCVTSEDLILKSKLSYLILEKTPVYENKKNIEKTLEEQKKIKNEERSIENTNNMDKIIDNFLSLDKEIQENVVNLAEQNYLKENSVINIEMLKAIKKNTYRTYLKMIYFKLLEIIKKNNLKVGETA